jgi:M6 family metalloprotease-like protein
MKKIFSSFMLALLMMAFTCSALYAVPANPIAQQLTQPSGQKFYARQFGDEKFNWTANDSGDVLTKGTNGYWCYSQVLNKNIVPTNKRVGIDVRPQIALKRTDLLTRLQAETIIRTPFTLKPKVVPMTINKFKNIVAIKDLVPVDTQKILVLLVSFSNKTIQNTASTWNNAFFGTGLDSVNTYYKEVSGGRIQFAPAQESNGTANDGMVKVTLNYNHPNTGSNTNVNNIKITRDALIAADSYVNFAQFDTNGNGYISTDELHIVVITAGYERSYSSNYSPAVWAHRWNLSDNVNTAYATTLDGKGLGNKDYKGGYTQQGEIHDNHRATIGIVCHELGHDLGLPDLYDYGYDSAGLGDHSLMAFGSWSMVPGASAGSSPAHLDAWSKIKLGFASATDAFGTTQLVQSNNMIVSLNKTVEHIVYSFIYGKYNIIKISTSNPNEYLLIENRQFNGYDKGLSSYVTKGGIEILHIDESVTTNNDLQWHKLVDVEESNQAALGYSQLDLMKYNRFNSSYTKLNSYYCAGNATVFGTTSNPNSNLYTGAGTYISISCTAPASPAMKVSITKYSPIALRPINTVVSTIPTTTITTPTLIRTPVTR